MTPELVNAGWGLIRPKDWLICPACGCWLSWPHYQDKIEQCLGCGVVLIDGEQGQEQPQKKGKKK